MSLTEIRNGVLMFSNPAWAGVNTVPSTLVRNISALNSPLGYKARISTNLTTLTNNNAEKLSGSFGGLLFVPQVTSVADCDREQYEFIPQNVTRRSNLPPTNFNVVAIAPWFSINCTLAYLKSASHGSIRAFIFYKPNNSTNKPQEVDSPVWNLDDGGAWRKKNHFPIFAIPGLEGQKIVTQLSLYSGNVNQVPHGQEISQLYGSNPNDYVRVWTDLTLENQTNMPAVWAFVLIVIAALLSIITAVSLTMHFVQRRNRESLKRRVQTGEVDLEAMGIKRLTVPASHLKSLPLFTYNADPDHTNDPPTPDSAAAKPAPTTSRRKSRRSDRKASNTSSDPTLLGSSRSLRRMRNKRSMGDTTATNHQPDCQICLATFEHRVTIIRELPCGHIFHPACIDEFLTQNSSLCPMCKQCMLPRGYSPRITNGMVRRERAIRRLRERVDLEASSLESGETKLKLWRNRLFSPSGHGAGAKSASNFAMTPLPTACNTSDGPLETDAKAPVEGTTLSAASEAAEPTADRPDSSQVPLSTGSSRPRSSRPRALRLLSTHHEMEQPKESNAEVGRSSPSSFARERMREIAAKNAPFDDPDHQRPKWRRAISKAFPGF
ncbi:uncharacterized protein DCS_03761 [Drechmeria coniospora]|uniref:RING-type domain-containing protein n=1 Tax=Drechmeria coniospora TaxID=98403 RepID=A0A151GI20_DRECN|nr:uncharacterized protein DCS_03761 [Drechmeria coniospora]KYK56755.1 uncharacterized protein DCS_03761 [Drechmeria coniospora]